MQALVCRSLCTHQQSQLQQLKCRSIIKSSCKPAAKLFASINDSSCLRVCTADDAARHRAYCMSTCGLCGLSSVHELVVGPTLLPHLPVAPSWASAGKCVDAAPDCSEVCAADSCESHKACHLNSPIGSYMRSVRASLFQLHVATAPSAFYFSVKTG